MNNTDLYIYAASANAWPIDDHIPNLKPQIKELCGRSFRRTNHYIDLGILGANRCASHSEKELSPQCGVFIATEQGNVSDGIDINKQIFVDKEAPMPFQFINVSNNLAGFYVAQSLNLLSTNITISRRDFPFEAALEMASLDLQLSNLDSCLVGGLDECSLPLDQHCQRMSLPVGTPLSEGSSWLYIGNTPQDAIAKYQLFSPLTSYEEMINTLDDIDIDSHYYLSGGYRINEEELQNISQSLGITRRYDYLETARYHDTNAAYGISAFIEQKKGRHLLHINKDYLNRYIIIYVSTI